LPSTPEGEQPCCVDLKPEVECDGALRIGAGILALLLASVFPVGYGRIAKSLFTGILTTGKLLRSDSDFLCSSKKLSKPLPPSLLLL
jgi:hypothetical protein